MADQPILGKIFSALDSVKRALSVRGLEATAERMVQLHTSAANSEPMPTRANPDALLQSARNMSAEAIDKYLAFNPAGITLFHGGPQAITKVLTEKLGTVGQAFGPGFYTSEMLDVPIAYARRAARKGSSPLTVTPNNGNPTRGVVTAFEFPDELYAKLLPLTDRSITRVPALSESVIKLAKENPKYATRMAMEDPDNISGEMIDWVLNSTYGKTIAANKLQDAGIPGKRWQYSADSPENAALIFQQYVGELRPLTSAPVPTDNAELVQTILEQALGKSISRPGLTAP